MSGVGFVDVAKQAGALERLRGLLGADDVLDHDDQELVGMGVHPLVDPVQGVVELGRPELAEDVAEIRLGIAVRLLAEPQPADQILGPFDRFGSELLGDLLTRLVLAAEIGDHAPEPATRLPDAVVGVDQQRPDAVVELADDPVALIGQEPARLGGSRHRVMGAPGR